MIKNQNSFIYVHLWSKIIKSTLFHRNKNDSYGTGYCFAVEYFIESDD